MPILTGLTITFYIAALGIIGTYAAILANGRLRLFGAHAVRRRDNGDKEEANVDLLGIDHTTIAVRGRPCWRDTASTGQTQSERPVSAQTGNPGPIV